MNEIGFWATVELLVALDATSHSHPFEDDIEDWLENVSSKVKMQLKRNNANGNQEGETTGEDDEDAAESVDYGNLIECTFSYPPVRSRLELLMGSNVVRLTDRKYMLKLMSRIRQDHETQQQARIQDRKTRELMRTKKLILNRFIPVQEAPTEIQEYPLFQLYSYCDAITELRRKKRVSRKVRISKSLYRLLYPEKPEEPPITYGIDDDDEEESEDEQLELDDEFTKEVIVDGLPQRVALTPKELEEREKQREIAKDVQEGYMFSRDEYDKLHYEAESVKKLKETKTVEEMYKKAHEIVGMLYSLANNEKRKRCERIEETFDSSMASESNVDAVSASRPVK